MDRLQIIYSTTITLFSNLIFLKVLEDALRAVRKRWHKGSYSPNEGVPSDIKFTYAAMNDMDSDPNETIAIYRQRWEFELPFKQIKRNFPLKYF